MKSLLIGIGILLLFGVLPVGAADQAPDSRPTSQSLEDLHTSAQAGNAKAQMKLAAMYLRGSGVTRNVPRALAWYQAAADQNIAFAQHRLALLYLAGEVVERDSDRALALLQSASKLGFVESQLELSRLYEAGQHVPQDYVSAHKWLSIAASLAEIEVEPRQQELEAKMSFIELATARYLSRRCMYNKYQDC